MKDLKGQLNWTDLVWSEIQTGTLIYVTQVCHHSSKAWLHILTNNISSPEDSNPKPRRVKSKSNSS